MTLADASNEVAPDGVDVFSWPVSTDFQRPVFSILGLPFDALGLDAAVALVADAAAVGRRCFFSTPNLNFVVGCLKDEEFRRSVLQSDLSVADGMPLVWVARALGLPFEERVAGSSIFERLRQARRAPISSYVFGGAKGAAAAACRALNASPTGIVCKGYLYPGYGSVEQMSSDEIIGQINDTGTDFLVVALGAKKGQLWILANLDRLRPPIVSHLGAVVNFVAGTVARAPVLWQRLGFEWFWRIRQEPTLWQRYAFDGLTFLRLLVTRVLPTMVDIRLNNPSHERLATATVSVVAEGETRVIVLSGPWTRANLGPLRVQLAEVAKTPADIIVDLERLEFVDGAFIALLLLLRGHQGKVRRELRLRSASPSTRSRFRRYCVDFIAEGAKAPGS